MDSKSLHTALNQIAEIPELEYLFFEQQLEWRTLGKGQYLLQCGEVCKQLYYCHSGIFRMFYTTQDGSEFNKSFITANGFFTSYSSLILNMPSYLSIQALEASEIAFFSQHTLEHLYQRHRCWETLGRKLVEALYMKKELRERQLLIYSAEERYRLFLRQFPGVEKRIPQYHIASYLGISPVSLSRIKGQLADCPERHM